MKNQRSSFNTQAPPIIRMDSPDSCQYCETTRKKFGIRKRKGALFRGDTRSPEKVLEKGLNARNVEAPSMQNYVKGAAAPWVGTSKHACVGAQFSLKHTYHEIQPQLGYLYEIKRPSDASSVNKLYPENPLSMEEEVIIPKRVSTRNIRNTYIHIPKKMGQKYNNETPCPKYFYKMKNPHFHPPSHDSESENDE